jgi:hypothetical protein
MAEETKPRAEKQVENLELNRETVQDLTDLETEAVQGGLLPAVDPPARGQAGSHAKSEVLAAG